MLGEQTIKVKGREQWLWLIWPRQPDLNYRLQSSGPVHILSLRWMTGFKMESLVLSSHWPQQHEMLEKKKKPRSLCPRHNALCPKLINPAPPIIENITSWYGYKASTFCHLGWKNIIIFVLVWTFHARWTWQQRKRPLLLINELPGNDSTFGGI